MFNQMSAQKVIKIFGERSVDGILKEYTQLYGMNVFAKVKSDRILRE